MKSGKNIGDVFKDNLYDYSEQPSGKVWENIQNNPDLIKYNRIASFSYAKLFTGIAAVAIVSVASYFLYEIFQTNENQNVIVENTITPPSKHEKTDIYLDVNEDKNASKDKLNVPKTQKNHVSTDNVLVQVPEKFEDVSPIKESDIINAIKNDDKEDKYIQKTKVEHSKDSQKLISKTSKEIVVIDEKPRNTLSVNPVSASNDTIICRWTSVDLSVFGTETVFWSDGQTDKQITVNPNESSVYTVRAVRNDGSDTLLKIFVQVVDCHQIYIPTAFTPDGDGRNDEFKPVYNGDISDFEMFIFTRSGRKVFESKDINLGWDGRVSGSQIEEGAYFYVIRYRDASDKQREQTGQVILYRSR